MTVNKKDLLKQIIDLEDQIVLNKIANLLEQATKTINDLKAVKRDEISADLDLKELKKEQNHESKDLVAFMETWNYEEWKDIDIEKAINAID